MKGKMAAVDMTSLTKHIDNDAKSLEAAESREEVLARLYRWGRSRLGWAFRDRLQFFEPWQEPPPRQMEVDPRIERAARMARARVQDAPAMAGATLLAGFSVALPIAIAGSPPLLTSAFRFFFVMAPFVVGLSGWVAYSFYELQRTSDRLAAARSIAERLESTGQDDWASRRDAHNQEEWEVVDQIPEWSPIQVASEARVDIFGGSLRSWSGFLTTFLTSVIEPEQRVFVADLTTSSVVDEAVGISEMLQIETLRLVLPDGLAGMLGRLSTTDLIRLCVDLVHGAADVQRAEDRVVDTEILRGVASALEPSVTASRLRAGLRVLLGEPGPYASLTAEEQTGVSSSLFSAEFVQQAHQRIRVLSAYLAELSYEHDQPSPQVPQSAGLTAVSLGRSGEISSDLLVNLTVQWMTGQAQGAQPPRTIVLAGADRVPLALLERLSDRCEERHVQLVVMFQHLRDDVARFVGGGRAVAFMRLGNHLEAEAAANFIGRGHHFVLSQLTQAYGGQSNQAGGTQKSASEAQSHHLAYALLFDLPTGRSDTFTTSWGSSMQFTEGTNWSYNEAAQRVYEYRVEPSHLQGLPDYTMLLVKPHSAGPQLQPLECCPDIATLPRVSKEPFELHPSGWQPQQQALPGSEGRG